MSDQLTDEELEEARRLVADARDGLRWLPPARLLSGLVAEVDRLRSVLYQARQACEEWQDDVASLKAERDRLRAVVTAGHICGEEEWSALLDRLRGVILDRGVRITRLELEVEMLEAELGRLAGAKG